MKQSSLANGTEGTIDNGNSTWTVTYAVYDAKDSLTYNTYTSGAITGGKGTTDGGAGGVITGNAPKEDIPYALGGGIYLAGSSNASFIMNDGAVSDNAAASTYEGSGQGSGGGAYIGPSSTLGVKGSVFYFNKAKGVNANGGAIFNQGTFTAENTVFSGNTSEHWTGGIVGACTLTDCVLVNNKTGDAADSYGGALSGGGTIKGCVISHNTATGSGGGVHLSGNTTISGSYIQYNASGGSGGGAEVQSKSAGNGRKISIEDSIIRNNGVSNTSSQEMIGGGGIFVGSADLTITGEKTVISGNKATGSTSSIGGGLFAGSKTTKIEAGTFTDNTATNGGGIAVTENGTFSMSGGTVTKNNATSTGDGIYVNAISPEFSGVVVVKENISDTDTMDNLTFVSSNTVYQGVLAGALTDGAEIGVRVTGAVSNAHTMFKAADNYDITTKDLTHIVYDGDGYALYLDSTEDKIKLSETPVTITYYASGDSGPETTTTQVVASGKESMIKANTFVRTDYMFKKWDANPSGGGTSYQDGAVITASSTVNLYAQWNEVDALLLNADKSNVIYGKPITLTAAPSVDGWEYRWYKVNGETENKIRDESGATLTLNDVADSGTYKVKITRAGTTSELSSGSVDVVINKATPEISISASDTALTGGTVTLTVTATGLPDEAEVNVICNNGITPNKTDGTWTATLPNTTATYTFTATYAGDNNHNEDSGTCIVSVTRDTSGGGSSSSSSGGSTTYTVSTDAGRNGDVTVSPSRASYGDTVTITVKPDSGYKLDELTVTDASGNEISVRNRGNNQYIFTMPRSRVTIEATFAEIEEEPDLFFVDVPTSAYYYDAVMWAVENGVTYGTSATTFSPDATVTRAQAVTFHWRAAGSPTVPGGSFADVADDAYYAGAVSWAVANGVTNGTGGNNFSPDVGVSRAQAVTFLWRQLA